MLRLPKSLQGVWWFTITFHKTKVLLVLNLIAWHFWKSFASTKKSVHANAFQMYVLERGEGHCNPPHAQAHTSGTLFRGHIFEYTCATTKEKNNILKYKLYKLFILTTQNIHSDSDTSYMISELLSCRRWLRFVSMIISNQNSLIRISARRKPRSEQFPIQVLLPISCFGPFGTEEPAGNSSYEVFQ